jgi:hypothetical protein
MKKKIKKKKKKKSEITFESFWCNANADHHGLRVQSLINDFIAGEQVERFARVARQVNFYAIVAIRFQSNQVRSIRIRILRRKYQSNQYFQNEEKEIKTKKNGCEPNGCQSYCLRRQCSRRMSKVKRRVTNCPEDS